MDLLKIYKDIFLIRTVEKSIDELFKAGHILGTAHFCIGQEFIPVIISQYINKEDIVTSTHRGHGHALSKKLDVKKFIAELMGKEEGYNCGKSGSQHIISTENNFYANGITGGMIPIANGMAFANKYFNNNRIVVAYLGDGGFNEGYVLESLNIASVFKLPILFICENNFYAMSTPFKNAHSSEINRKVSAFGIKCDFVEDNDYKKLDEIAKKFVEETRMGQGPRFIEVKTYRHCGHSKNDLNLYRDKDEEKIWFNKDVLPLIRAEIISRAVKEEEINLIETNCEKNIKEIINDLLMEK